MVVGFPLDVVLATLDNSVMRKITAFPAFNHYLQSKPSQCRESPLVPVFREIGSGKSRPVLQRRETAVVMPDELRHVSLAMRRRLHMRILGRLFPVACRRRFDEPVQLGFEGECFRLFSADQLNPDLESFDNETGGFLEPSPSL
jgi:hypothetical protein